jgi:hypothetical protein
VPSADGDEAYSFFAVLINGCTRSRCVMAQGRLEAFNDGVTYANAENIKVFRGESMQEEFMTAMHQGVAGLKKNIAMFAIFSIWFCVNAYFAFMTHHDVIAFFFSFLALVQVFSIFRTFKAISAIKISLVADEPG